MKHKRGFTLVELLAVIVILAIIMIIAIPAVLNTMQTARKKTFLEFGQKCINEAQKVFLEKQVVESLIHPSEKTIYLFDIKKDLEISNTGNYYGYVGIEDLLDEDGVRSNHISLLLLDDNYILDYYEWGDHELSIDLIQDNSSYVNFFKDSGLNIDNYDFKKLEALMTAYELCNYWDTSTVDIATNTQYFCTNKNHREYFEDGHYDDCMTIHGNDEELKIMSIVGAFNSGNIISNCP